MADGKHVPQFSLWYTKCTPSANMATNLQWVLYENLALITGHCMEYTLACIWCYYYDDGLEVANNDVHWD